MWRRMLEPNPGQDTKSSLMICISHFMSIEVRVLGELASDEEDYDDEKGGNLK